MVPTLAKAVAAELAIRTPGDLPDPGDAQLLYRCVMFAVCDTMNLETMTGRHSALCVRLRLQLMAVLPHALPYAATLQAGATLSWPHLERGAALTAVSPAGPGACAHGCSPSCGGNQWAGTPAGA